MNRTRSGLAPERRDSTRSISACVEVQPGLALFSTLTGPCHKESSPSWMKQGMVAESAIEGPRTASAP